MTITTNFSSSKIHLTSTIHVGIRSEYGQMIDWLEGRYGQVLPEIAAVGRILAQHATAFEGETYLAREHITRFSNLVGRVSASAEDEAHVDFALLARLRDLNGRPTLNGGEIRAIRIRQGRGE